MPKVSIIIPVYNTEKYLDICLDSIINQSFTDFEVICVSDGSTDSSLSIAKQYSLLDRRIKIVAQPNKGLASAKNTGIKFAKGNYITFAEADDILSPVAIERLYNNITLHNSDYNFCNIFYFNPMRKYNIIWELLPQAEFKEIIKKPVFCESDTPPEFYFKMHTMAYGKMYRADFIKDFLFPEGLSFEDMPFFTKCFLSAEKISYDFEPLYFYRQHENSIVSTRDKRLLDIFEINKLVTETFIENGVYEKYKTHLLVNQMENTLIRMLELSGRTQKEMFRKWREVFKDINFLEYDINILKTKNIFYAYQDIMNKSYIDFKLFEDRIKK